MELKFNELDNNIRLIKLIGKLDITSTNEIENRFKDYCTGQKVHVIVDLSEVDFLASIGIRLLTLTAKAVASRGGKMVIMSPTPDVQNVLELTGIPAIIPIYSYLEPAETILMAS